MKSKTYNGKAFADGYAKGKAEAADTIRQLQAALNKALAENLAMRGAPAGLTHLDAVARQGSHAAISR
jgi:hypothetical protein